VRAGFVAKHDVVYLRKDRVTAPGDATFPTVPVKDRTTDSGGNGLSRADPDCAHVSASICVVVRVNGVAYAHVCASVVVSVHVGASAYLRTITGAHVGVHVADVLPIALSHLDDFGADFDELTATLLRRPPAALANRERDLVAGAARVLGAPQSLTAEEQDGCVVIESLARIAANFRHRFPKGGEDLAREVEAEHVALEAGVRDVVGEASRTMARDEVLDLTHRPPPGGFEPFPLGGRCCYASQFTREREADGADLEAASGFGELFEGFGDTKLFLSEAGAIAEEALGVFEEGGVPEAQVGSCAVGSQKPTSLLEIETRTLGGEADELFVRLTPSGAFQLHHDC